MLKTIGLITNPNETIASFNNKKNYIPGIVMGIIAMLSFPLMSLIARILAGKSNQSDIIKTLSIGPILSLVLFVLCVSCVYLLSRLFKGSNNYLTLANNMGWASIPNIFFSITCAFLLIANNFLNAFPEYKSAILLIAVLGVFLMIAELIWAMKIAVLSISITMRLSKVKAIIVFVLSTITFFIPFNYLSKLLASSFIN